MITQDHTNITSGHRAVASSMKMPPPEARQACRPCAKAKRRCGKEQPSCRRCRLRGELCEYPAKPQAPSVAMPASDWTASSIAFDLASPETATPTATGTNGTREHSPHRTRHCLSWYLGAETWTVEHKDETITLSTSFSSAFLRRYVTNLKQWLARWTCTGECPFIHPQLYIARFPTDLQVAYTTCISYNNRKPKNTDIILKIVEDQVSKLVLESGATAGAEICFATSTDNTTPRASLLEQLARLQALIIYQVIGLFDGDIRLRHLAEGRLALLLKWSRHLLDSARHKFAASPTAATDITLALQNGPMDSLEHSWYLWILTESIRRTWLVATGIEGIYYMLQRGWHPCPGGVMLTTRQGVWSAQGSQAWEKLCTEQDIGFMRRFEIDRLFVDARPADVDEFTQVMMEVTYGSERTERWKST